MQMKQCPQCSLHYDASVYSQCPYCTTQQYEPQTQYQQPAEQPQQPQYQQSQQDYTGQQPQYQQTQQYQQPQQSYPQQPQYQQPQYQQYQQQGYTQQYPHAAGQPPRKKNNAAIIGGVLGGVGFLLLVAAFVFIFVFMPRLGGGGDGGNIGGVPTPTPTLSPAPTPTPTPTTTPDTSTPTPTPNDTPPPPYYTHDDHILKGTWEYIRGTTPLFFFQKSPMVAFIGTGSVFAADEDWFFTELGFWGSWFIIDDKEIVVTDHWEDAAYFTYEVSNNTLALTDPSGNTVYFDRVSNDSPYGYWELEDSSGSLFFLGRSSHVFFDFTGLVFPTDPNRYGSWWFPPDGGYNSIGIFDDDAAWAEYFEYRTQDGYLTITDHAGNWLRYKFLNY
ncbi:MAG: hypothetical protein FWD44_05195 [Oscillospiraceae bacterium]|nr:hypothetical protein [Oscillospiraceae bacterium]